jgi:hypothetical protein
MWQIGAAIMCQKIRLDSLIFGKAMSAWEESQAARGVEIMSDVSHTPVVMVIIFVTCFFWY